MNTDTQDMNFYLNFIFSQVLENIFLTLFFQSVFYPAVFFLVTEMTLI